MDDLRRLAVFAAVVRHRSMSAAGRALGMSPSAVSQQVRLLEKDGGVTLLHRSTRKLRLTDAGERLHVACAAMVAQAELARAELHSAREAPSGELRIAATVGFARHIAPALGELLASHPALSLQLLVDDSPVDLIEARVDLAVRFGKVPDMPWAARRLGSFDWCLCASPQWLAQHGEPASPEALLGHAWVGFARTGGVLMPSFRGPAGQLQTLRIQPRIGSNNQLSIQQMCEAGLGPAMLGMVDVHEALEAGRLRHLLPEWQAGSLDVWALTPQRDAQPAKVRHAIAALGRYLAGVPGMRPPG
ncbi:LysR substrate-binding domain-containing protein [Ideonella azotifigens]|uniref:LysR family transcriptional regulator n=1 Tax=Ideonella azotifigens TaxID=513160 RepID=A0ABN1JU87_9BURK|nr:LysR family transcriptional regulator [Ideonella azotifigens]MCD2341107.1 LysR substrate-binding domain-containing protein [Ideonella azotifigens]